MKFDFVDGVRKMRDAALKYADGKVRIGLMSPAELHAVSKSVNAASDILTGFDEEREEVSHLKAGDICKLNSGGPEMTIGKIDEKNQIAWCQWFNGYHGGYNNHTFKLSCLTAVAQAQQ